MPHSQLLVAKIAHGFDHLDGDGDGKLTEYDHVLSGRRVAKSLGHAPGTDAEQQIIDAYLWIWRELHLPYIPGGGDFLTKEQFVSSTLTLAEDPQAAEASVGRLAEVFLSIADTDADGRVGRAEFCAFVGGHFPRLGKDELTAAFSHLDSDGDGCLLAEEFVGAIIDYWSSDDPEAPGNWWMGPPLHLRT